MLPGRGGLNHPGPINESLLHWAQLILILISPASGICKQGFGAVLPRQCCTQLQVSLCTRNTDAKLIRRAHGALNPCVFG